MATDRSEEGAARVHDLCRVCGSSDLVPYLDMGLTPLANAYLHADQLDAAELRAELALQVCPGCGLSQLTRVVDRDLMFRDYLYVSSTTATFRGHCAELATTAVEVSAAGPGDLVLDIASNDGLLLSCFRDLGLAVRGVDPARNLAAEATGRGIPTIPEYWSADIARDLVGRHGHPRVITATNVLAHVDDVHEFVGAVGHALGQRSIFVIEVPYVMDLIERNEFDTAYHEHLSYFGLNSLRKLLGAHGLEIFDVDHFPEIHGGTIRVFACRAGLRQASLRVGRMIKREIDVGITDPAVHVAFGERARANMAELREVVTSLRSRGELIWAYGASAKGNTLMNFSGMRADAVPVVVDDNPKKWGFFTPGAHMRIVGPAELAVGEVDRLLLLAWNFEAEIVARSRSAGYRGGYIRPVPSVELVPA